MGGLRQDLYDYEFVENGKVVVIIRVLFLAISVELRFHCYFYLSGQKGCGTIYHLLGSETVLLSYFPR